MFQKGVKEILIKASSPKGISYNYIYLQLTTVCAQGRVVAKVLLRGKVSYREPFLGHFVLLQGF